MNKPLLSYIDLLESLPHMAYIIDENSRFVFANQVTRRLCNDAHELSGSSYHQMRCPASECAQEFQTQDQLVLSEGEGLTVIGFCQYADGQRRILHGTKSLIQTGGSRSLIVGIFSDVSQDPNFQPLADLAAHDSKRFFSADDQLTYVVDGDFQFFHSLGLTRRERESFFWTIRGRSAGQIANILGLSRRTVESYLENLKNKLVCQSKAELIDFAFAHGLVNYIPKSLWLHKK